MSKLQLQKITLTRTEGPIQECTTKVFTIKEGETTEDLFNHAQHQLSIWGHTAPPEGQGYDKCDAIVEWNDEHNLKTRFDLQHGGHTSGNLSLRDSISSTIKCYAGVWCPDHLKKHHSHLLARNPDFTKAMTNIFNSCEL